MTERKKIQGNPNGTFDRPSSRMKHTWPPSEDKGWTFQTTEHKAGSTEFHLPMVPMKKTLLAFRVKTPQTIPKPFLVTLHIANGQNMTFHIFDDEWIYLPYPVESHTIGSVWKSITSNIKIVSIEWGFYDVYLNSFRMRALVNEEGKMTYGYRMNKNGQVIFFTGYKDETMVLPEDTYILYPTPLLNEHPFELRSAKSTIQVECLKTQVQ